MNDSIATAVKQIPITEDDVPDIRYVSLSKLRQTIVDLFSENELRDLCFDLSVDYESLPAVGKSDKARELIEHFKRRQRLNVLLVGIRDQRPAIVWQTIATEETPSSPGDTLTGAPQDRENTIMAGKSFTMLIRFMRKPEVRAAIIAFLTDFQAASTQINLMNDYKQVHDLFQELENRYFLIYNDQKRLPDDDIAWDSIGMNEPELRSKIDDLVETAKRATFAADEARWTQQLEKVNSELHQAVEEFDLAKLQDSTRLLYRVLNRQPSRINAQLVTTASTMRLDALEKAMITICENLSSDEFDLEAVRQIKEGVDALAGLDERLANLVKEHNAWQELDDELRRVEGSLDQGIDELQDSWEDLEPLTRKLYGRSAEEWAVQLQKMASSLEQALGEGAIANVRRLFRRLRSQVSRRFRRVDFELLMLCQNLQKVGESLDILLRNFK